MRAAPQWAFSYNTPRLAPRDSRDSLDPGNEKAERLNLDLAAIEHNRERELLWNFAECFCRGVQVHKFGLCDLRDEIMRADEKVIYTQTPQHRAVDLEFENVTYQAGKFYFDYIYYILLLLYLMI